MDTVTVIGYVVAALVVGFIVYRIYRGTGRGSGSTGSGGDSGRATKIK